MVSVITPVCDRTSQVRDAIVTAVPNVTDCDDVTEAHLEAITELILRGSGINSLQVGDFDGLSNLEELYLERNNLSSLPAGIFGGLSNLRWLGLSLNGLSTVPSGVFDGLSNLRTLDMSRNQRVVGSQYQKSLSSLPAGVFDDLTSLTTLNLGVNALSQSSSSLPAGIFSKLTSLTKLDLANNNFTSLPSDIFDGLSSLTSLQLNDNFSLSSLSSGVFDELTSLEWLYLSRCMNLGSLPAGVFDELTSLKSLYLNSCILSSFPSGVFANLSSLTSLWLSSNRLDNDDIADGIFDGLTLLSTLSLGGNVESIRIQVSLETVADGEFKAVVPTGAPFNMVLPLTVTDGTIDGGATNITVSTGKLESDETLTVTRTAGTTGAVTVQIGNLPSLPTHVDSKRPNHTGYSFVKGNENGLVVIASTNSAPVLTDGDSTTRSVAEDTASGVDIGSAVSATDADNDTLTYTLSGTDAASFSIDSTTGQLQTSATLDYETKSSYSVTITVSDGSLTDTITVTINVTEVTVIGAPVFTEGGSTTRSVAEDTASGGVVGSAVSATDADNDTLTYTLSGTDAASFSIDSTTGQLSTLAALNYETQSVYTVTITVSDGSLTDTINVIINVTNVVEFLLGSMITSVCERTSQVRDAIVAAVPDITDCNDVTATHLAAITELNLNFTNITALQTGDFGGLSSLTTLSLGSNNLSSLPAGIFDGLFSLVYITLNNNSLSSLPAGIFSDLTSLEWLRLENNDLGSLPDGIFEGLTSLTTLWMNDNQLFEGIPLSVSLEAVGDDQFKAVAPTGVPFTIVLPISVTNGRIKNGATTATIHKGSVESSPLALARTPSTSDPITVNIGTLPSLPTATFLSQRRHQGYYLTKSGTLPLTFTGVAEVAESVISLTPVCNRTSQVRDAIVAAVPDITDCNDVTAAHLAAITELNLNFTNITALQTGDFGGLSSLTTLSLGSNSLSSLPAGIFDGLSSLVYIILNNNSLSSLPAGIFSDLTSLEWLHLEDNDLGSLPDGIFEGLTSLTTLWMNDNQLSEGIPLSVSLEAVGDDQFKAVAPIGAPFEIVLSISVTNGTIDGGATTATIHKGSLESEALTVTRTADTSDAVTVNIGDPLPSLPTAMFLSQRRHQGYYLTKSGILPLVILGDTDLTAVCDRTAQVRDAIVAAVPGITDCNDVTATHLAAITELDLSSDSITALAVGDFGGLSNLQTLDLSSNDLTSLPAGIFEGLSSLTNLWLTDNELRNAGIPDNLLSGLSSLNSFRLGGTNSILFMQVSLKKVGEGQFKAGVRTGAPFNLVLPFTVTNGSIGGGKTNITIPTGNLESDETLAVTRTSGTTAAVTVQFRNLPGLPTHRVSNNLAHIGYTLVRANEEALEIISAVPGAPSQTAVAKPDETALLSNFPNPFNPETWLPYQLAKASNVSITIYDTRGRVVRRLDLGHKRAGYYVGRSRAAHWDGRNASGEKVATGIYFYQFQADNVSFLRKMVILK